MHIPSPEALPLKAKAFQFAIDEASIKRFHRAFKETEGQYTPPTLGAVFLRGVFELIDLMQIDWKDLLHASQNFSYQREITSGLSLEVVSQLSEHKYRAKMHWLTFESFAYAGSQDTEPPILSCRTLIMVKDVASL